MKDEYFSIYEFSEIYPKGIKLRNGYDNKSRNILDSKNSNTVSKIREEAKREILEQEKIKAFKQFQKPTLSQINKLKEKQEYWERVKNKSYSIDKPEWGKRIPPTRTKRSQDSEMSSASPSDR